MFVGDTAVFGRVGSARDFPNAPFVFRSWSYSIIRYLLYPFLKEQTMASGTGFFKGEKKKKKKGEQRPIGVSPVFIPPSVIPKGKIK